MSEMRIISVRENKEYLEQTIHYLQQSWAEVSSIIYDNSVRHCIDAENPLPQWYLLEKGESIIGCAGLITNDFISRIDLYPWLCALYIAEEHRGNTFSKLLIDRAKNDARKMGYRHLNLCTDHIGLYEKFGWEYIGQGYHPWDEESRIYQIGL